MEDLKECMKRIWVAKNGPHYMSGFTLQGLAAGIAALEQGYADVWADADAMRVARQTAVEQEEEEVDAVDAFAPADAALRDADE